VSSPRVGVLALQGDVAEHIAALERCGARAIAVRRPADLEGLEGLIIPGGESTTIGDLASEYGLLQPMRRMATEGFPIWGTCAGLILLARDVGRDQPLLSALDITVDRNAFGRQVDSFETDLQVEGLAGGPFRAVFIRAPAVTAIGPAVHVIARLTDGTIVAVRQGQILGTAFHPELAGDDRFHTLFLGLVTNGGDQ
jgi:pyridoxal 5'-phosphate synthase pdxT subunit